MKVEHRDKIHFSDVKKGQFIKMQNSHKYFVVVPHGQTLSLIPVDLKATINYNKFDINIPEIEAVFNCDGKLVLTTKEEE